MNILERVKSVLLNPNDKEGLEYLMTDAETVRKELLADDGEWDLRKEPAYSLKTNRSDRILLILWMRHVFHSLEVKVSSPPPIQGSGRWEWNLVDSVL